MQIKSIGIDLGKTTFHLIALGVRSQVVIRRKFSRSQLLLFTANLSPSLIGMEAGVGSLIDKYGLDKIADAVARMSHKDQKQ